MLPGATWIALRRCCILLGYTRDEMLSKTIEDVSYDVNEVPRLFALYLKTGAMEGEYVLRRKDTMPVPIRYKAFVLKDGCNAAIWDPIKDWREPYLAALLEMDSAKLKRKLEVALAAIQAARASQGPSVSALNSLLRTVKPGPTMSR
jgi:PAS domain-containing protein